jgi:hypothetical protein
MTMTALCYSRRAAIGSIVPSIRHIESGIFVRVAWL